MGLLQNLIHLMTPDVMIEVRRDQFTFRCQDRGESVEPVLWITDEGRRARVVGIGTTVALTQPANRVDLFGGDWSRRPDQEQVELAAAFCRYGITKVLRRSFACPSVTMRGVGLLSNQNKSMERSVLEKALEMVIVHDVRWDGDV
jgi:hypothetical protein